MTPADARMDIFGRLRGSQSPPLRQDGRINDNPISAIERAGWHDFSAPTWFDILGERNKENDWYLLLKHRRNSLQEIVARTQQREFGASLGVLGLLAISMGIVIVASRRAHKLARMHVDFVAAVSHELRTPLAVICSAADNLADGVVQGKQQLNQYRSIIASQARQLTLLIEQILSFAASGGVRPQYHVRTLQVSEIVAAALEKTEGLLQDEQFTLERVIEPGLPPVSGDLAALSQCLQNLIVNAVKYSGGSRWIRIRAHSSKVEDGSREVQISVEDKGIGIAPGELKAIFQPFFRSPSLAKGQIHGTGLGLSLAKDIAEAMGGKVTVSSQLGKGSAFTVHLPAVTERTLNPEPVSLGV